MNIYEKIEAQGLTIREFCNPAWPFTTATQVGNILFVSGHTPTIDGVPQYHGCTGRDVNLETAQKAALLCLENCIGSMNMALGDLNRVKRIIKLNGFVASDPSFSGQAMVMNPVSEKLNAIFGEKHARAALGVAQLPGDVPVEIELIVEVE